jgi:hypothetical protein
MNQPKVAAQDPTREGLLDVVTWRARWDSLKLFSPAQYSSLPGMPFPAPADTYPTKKPVADYLQAYSSLIGRQAREGRCQYGRPSQMSRVQGHPSCGQVLKSRQRRTLAATAERERAADSGT